MSAGGSFDESEIRAEVFRTVAMKDERRTGDSDRLAVGCVTAVDLAEGSEDAEILGSLSDVVDLTRMTMVNWSDCKVEGKLTSEAHSESFMVGGSVSETFAGATMLLAGMSDDMVVGGGTRLTGPLDVTMAGLMGMEEKIGSAFADGFFSENAPVAFDREFGPGVHNCGTAVFEGHVLTTQATGFMPLMQTWIGVRNLTLGSHFSEGGTQNNSSPPPAAPPPVPPKTGRSGARMFRAANRSDTLMNMADAADAFEDMADLVAAAEDTRMASNGAEADTLENLRHGDAFGDVDTLPDGTAMAPQNPPTTFARYDVDEVRRAEKEWFNPETGEMERIVVEEAPAADNSFDDWQAVISAWAPPEDGPGSRADDAPPRVPSPDNGADAGNEGQPRSILKKPTEVFKENDPKGRRSETVAGFAGEVDGDRHLFELEENINLPDRATRDIFEQTFGRFSWSRPSSSAGGSQQQSYKLDRAAQTAAMEDMGKVEEELLTMEWFRKHWVTADPETQADLHKLQSDRFKIFEGTVKHRYEASEDNRSFASLYQQAVKANYDEYISQGGDPDLLGTDLVTRHKHLLKMGADDEILAQNLEQMRLARAWTESIGELEGMQEDFIDAAETFVRHQNPAQSPAPGLRTLVEPGGGEAATDLVQARQHVKTMDPGGAAAVPLSQVSDNALDRTIAYLDRVRGTGANPYLDALELEDVRNDDAYALLNKLLVDPVGEDAAKSRELADADAKLSAKIAALQDRADDTANQITPLEAKVRSLQKAVDKQQRNVDRAWTESGRKKAAAKLELLQADLDGAKYDLSQMQRRLRTQKSEIHKLKVGTRDEHGKLLKPGRLQLAEGPWRQTERRYEFLIDTLAVAREDLAAGYDPNVRLRYQADAFNELSNYNIADISGMGFVELNDAVFSRSGREAGLTLREKADLSMLVADLLVDLAARYGVDNAFMSTDSASGLNAAQLDDLFMGRRALVDLAAGQPASPGAANGLNPADAAAPRLPPRKAKLRRTAVGNAGPAPVGLSFNSGSAASYDFASGAADSPADFVKFDDIMVERIEADPPLDLLQRGVVADVPLEHVEIELPPGQQADSGDGLGDLHRTLDNPETDDTGGYNDPWGLNNLDFTDEDIVDDEVADTATAAPGTNPGVDDLDEPDDYYLDDISQLRREAQLEADEEKGLVDLTELRRDMEESGHRWPSGQGPVTDADGSSWILPTAGDDTPLNPISASALEVEVPPPIGPKPGTAEVPPSIGPKPGQAEARPVPKPRTTTTRNPAPLPVEGPEWRGVTEAVPDTPSPNEKPVPKPRARTSSITAQPGAAPPVDTVPVPENKAQMFGPTAAGDATELRQDDIAYPTATLDAGADLDDDDDKTTFLEWFGATPLAQPTAEPEEISPNPGQAASQSPPAIPPKKKGAEPQPPAIPPKKKGAKPPGWWSAGDTVDPDSIPAEYVIQPDALATPADGVIETYAAHSMKISKNNDPFFFDHHHVGLDTYPDKNYVIYEADLSSADWGKRVAEFDKEYPGGGRNLIDDDRGGLFFAQRAKLPLGQNRTTFWAFNAAAADAALYGADAKVSDEIVYADLDFVRQAIAKRPTDQLPPGTFYPSDYDGSVGGMLPKAIDARAKFRIDGAKIAPDLEKADAAFLEDIRTGLMGEDVKPLQRRGFTRKNGDGIAGTRGTYVDLLESAERNGRFDNAEKYRAYIEAIDSYHEARIAKASDLLDPGDGAKLPDWFFQRAHAGDLDKGAEDQHRFHLANWIRHGRETEGGKALVDQGTHDILSRVAMDAERGINPYARIDLETAYFQGLADAYYKSTKVPDDAPNPYQKRIDSLATARNHVEKKYLNNIVMPDYSVERASSEWRMTPRQGEEWIWAGKRPKPQKPKPKPMSSGGGQQVFGSKPPPLGPKPEAQPPPLGPKPAAQAPPKKKSRGPLSWLKS